MPSGATVNEFSDLIEDVRKMYHDLYLGGGKSDPSITTRLSQVEDCLARISTNLSKLTWIVIGILASVIGDIIIKFIK